MRKRTPEEGKRRQPAMRMVEHLMESGGKRNRAVTSPAPPSSSSASSVTGAFYSPRLLLSRWLQRPAAAEASPGVGEGVVGCRVRFPRHGHKKKREASSEEEAEEEERREAEGVPPRDQDSMESGGTSSVAPSVGCSSLGMKSGEASFNLGLSIGLLCLLAKGAMEFNKMAEVRRQMETLLKDIKDEVQRKDTMSSCVESDHDLVHSASASHYYETKITNVTSQNCRTSIHMTGAHCVMESDRQSKCGKPVQNNGYVKMGEMEAELEVELERLQLGVDQENSSILSHHMMEVASEGTNPSENSSLSVVEDNEPEEEDSSKYDAVSARELERRLHELLEAQQEERIAELESALELAQRKLREKEVEVCWWRDTARLASQQKNGTAFR